MRVGIFVSETWDAAPGVKQVRERARRALHRFADAGLTGFFAAPLAIGGATWERTAECLAAL